MNIRAVPLEIFFLVGLISSLSSFFATINYLDKSVAPDSQVAGESSYIAPQQEIPHSILIPTEPVYGFPVRLVIPQLNVDANISNMGLTSDGDMEVPEKIKDLGWYKYGPHPGMKGSAVIAGHLGVGEAGVFADLDKLKIGDTFWVVDDSDLAISFVVIRIRNYEPDDHPEEVFFSNEGYNLNLITCSGDWDDLTQGMTKRLVVFSERL